MMNVLGISQSEVDALIPPASSNVKHDKKALNESA
jgi:hypothetical protein